MRTSARIRALREASGISDIDAARRTGLTIHEYGDLESYDDELESVVSLATVRALAKCFGVSVAKLVTGGETDGRIVPAQSLPELVRVKMNSEGIDLEAFEDRVGWELREFMQSPEAVTEARPLMFLRAVAEAVGIQFEQTLTEIEHAA
jgi:transcriptional regulator with XRE-family HTH domain